MARNKIKFLDYIALILILIGAINWGATGFGYNLLEKLMGGFTFFVRLIYVLVGASGVYSLIRLATKDIRVRQ